MTVEIFSPSPCERWPDAVRCSKIRRLRIAENLWKPPLIAEFEQVQALHIASLYQQKGQYACDTPDEGDSPNAEMWLVDGQAVGHGSQTS